jgi:hypothetical protein
MLGPLEFGLMAVLFVVVILKSNLLARKAK